MCGRLPKVALCSTLLLVMSVAGCVDNAAIEQLRGAVANERIHVQGTIDVEFIAFGTRFTPRYTIRKGADAEGSYRNLRFDASKPVIAPAPSQPAKAGQVRPTNIQIEKTVRQDPVTPGLAARTIETIVAIHDFDAFVGAHTITRAGGSDTIVAGRPVDTLIAAPRSESGLQYLIRIDRERNYILAIEERDSKRALIHSVAFRSITFDVTPPPMDERFRFTHDTLTPAEAASAATALDIPVQDLFPVGAPEGFSHAEIVRTDAIDNIHLRYTNGTTTGVILVYLRKPRPRGHEQRRDWNPTERRELVLSGKAFVDGQWVGLTYLVGNLHCVELHTSRKSALILTPTGLDVAKEMAGFLPLP